MGDVVLIQLFSAVLGSSVVTALVTSLIGRRKNQAEVVEISVRNALALEQRAHDRYTTTSEALEEADKLLSFARTRIANQEEDIARYRRLLEEQGLSLPCLESENPDDCFE